MVEGLVEARNFPNESAGLTSLLGERFEKFGSHQRLLGDIESHHGDWPAATKGLIGGVGVAEDIGLGRWCDVSEMAMIAEGPSHDDEPPHQARDLWIVPKGQRESSQGTDGDNGHLLCMSPDHVDDKAISRQGIGLFCYVLRQRNVTEPIVAMNENGRVSGGSGERRARSLGYRYVDPETLGEIERIASGRRDRAIAVRCGDSDELDLRRITPGSVSKMTLILFISRT
jgi:hypothetical protein